MANNSEERHPRPSRALILGCGYVGERVAQRWLRHGIHVDVVTRSEDKAARLRTSGLEPIVGDITQPSTLPTIPVPDVLLWAVGFDRSGSASRQQLWVESLQAALTRFTSPTTTVIYISSTGVYGSCDGGTVDEFTAPEPLTEAGSLCLQAEHLVHSAPTDRQAMVLRLGGIYGPDRLLRRIEELRSCQPVDGAPDHWLNLIHVRDAAAVVEQAAFRPWPAIMNVVTTPTVTRRQYYELLAELTGCPAPVFQVTPPENDEGNRRKRSAANRRVVSAYAQQFADLLQFNDLSSGLRQAIEYSASPR
ncbi:MAG: NAD-binding protein [Planctomycetaceae bacterium]|nr:NAD-binding protein [Planctomycetaceae bacterium]